MTDATEKDAAFSYEATPVPYAFLQWKGTYACFDFHCKCEAHCHFDGYFAHYVKCPHCSTVYQMPFNLFPREVCEGEEAKPMVLMEPDEDNEDAGDDSEDVIKVYYVKDQDGGQGRVEVFGRIDENRPIKANEPVRFIFNTGWSGSTEASDAIERDKAAVRAAGYDPDNLMAGCEEIPGTSLRGGEPRPAPANLAYMTLVPQTKHDWPFSYNRTFDAIAAATVIVLPQKRQIAINIDKFLMKLLETDKPPKPDMTEQELINDLATSTDFAIEVSCYGTETFSWQNVAKAAIYAMRPYLRFDSEPEPRCKV